MLSSYLVLPSLGTTYFRHYKSSVIPYPTLWYFLFILIGLLGVWLFYSAFKSKAAKIYQEDNEAAEMMKRTATAITLDFDKCEFKNGSYTHEVENSSRSAIDLLTDHSTASKVVTEEVTRSYIVYTDDINGERGRFISQAFLLDLTMLRLQVMNGKIVLYVDRFDKKKYFFEMKE